MLDQLAQAAVDLLVQVLPILIAALSAWVLAKMLKLDQLIENEIIKRYSIMGLQIAVKYDSDGDGDSDLEEASEKLVKSAVTWTENILKAKGITANLDEIEAIMLAHIDYAFDTIELIEIEDNETPE